MRDKLYKLINPTPVVFMIFIASDCCKYLINNPLLLAD